MLVVCLLRAWYIIKLNEAAKEMEPIQLSALILGCGCSSILPHMAVYRTTHGFCSFLLLRDALQHFFVYSYFYLCFCYRHKYFCAKAGVCPAASVIYSLEIVFSTIFSATLPPILVDRIILTPSLVIGYVLVALGAFLSEFDATALLWLETEVVRMTQTQKTPLGRKIGRFLFLVLIHMLLSLPFKVMIMIPGFTRYPTSHLPAAYLRSVFGQTGALAFAVGNLISDVLSDSLQWSCIAGFIANYLYVVMVYKLWHMIRKKPFPA